MIVLLKIINYNIGKRKLQLKQKQNFKLFKKYIIRIIIMKLEKINCIIIIM